MEDRYLFKAKRVDDGEWVQGCYIYNIDRDCSESLNKFAHRIQPLYAHAYAEPIDPTTICQCTGLNDKNGKLIWENDIVKAKYSDGFEEITEVAYSKNGYSPYLNEYECEGCCCCCEVTEIEIIGNIFDNPELLESEEK
uniref:YopX family protein n=1 Tax=Lachnospira sp. TaxID=2049031 RepID=UPI0040262D42